MICKSHTYMHLFKNLFYTCTLPGQSKYCHMSTKPMFVNITTLLYVGLVYEFMHDLAMCYEALFIQHVTCVHLEVIKCIQTQTYSNALSMCQHSTYCVSVELICEAVKEIILVNTLNVSTEKDKPCKVSLYVYKVGSLCNYKTILLDINDHQTNLTKCKWYS